MSEALIRAQIQTTLQGVSGVGAVHDYERYPRSLADFFTSMKSGNKVNGWVIHRESTQSTRITLGVNGQIERAHKFKIAGFYELDDSAGSEKTFQGLLDAIFEAFKADSGLSGTAFRSDLLQIDSVTVTTVDELGADLYHIGEASLVVYERVST